MKKTKEHYEARRNEVYAKNRESIRMMWDDKEEVRKDVYRELINENSVIIEIGVRLAENAFLMYAHNPKKMFLVDPWENHPKDKKFYKRVKDVFAGCNNVQIIKSTSQEAVKKFENNFFDIVYIDAGHRYEEVLRDLDLWAPKIKSGGFIIGDDYFDNPEKDPLTEKYQIKWKKQEYGVVPAVGDFLKKNENFEIYYSDKFTEFPLAAGQFILRKK